MTAKKSASFASRFLWKAYFPICARKPSRKADVSRLLFGASYFHYREGVYTGKLLVLIDRRTASSAEAFAAMLGDSGAAAIVGQPSIGAGCGYTNGGIEIVLKNSGGRVKMPDCVRFRADGSNEAAGITPDISIPWRQNDTAFQKAKRTLEMLEKISTSKGADFKSIKSAPF
jgi:C-terminal processing protease CtpA/Prc